MKKLYSILSAVILALTCGQVKANSPIEDTIRIVKNGDTITIVTPESLDVIDTAENSCRPTHNVDKTLKEIGKFYNDKDNSVEIITLKSNQAWNNSVVLDPEVLKQQQLHRDIFHGVGSISFNFHYGYLTAGNDLFAKVDPKLALDWSSRWDFGLDLCLWDSKYFNVYLGLSYESDIFHFSDQEAICDLLGLFDNDIYTWAEVDYNEIISISKAKYTARYINAPIKLSFRLAKGIYANLGFSAGLNFNKATYWTLNIKDKINGTDFITAPDDDNIHRKMKYEASVGMSIYGLTLTYRQALSPVFKDEFGANMYPYSISIGFGL